MEDSREYHWRDVANDGEYKRKIHDLSWDVYTRDRDEFINKD